MSLTLETLQHDLESSQDLRLVSGRAGLTRELDSPDLNRPGLAMSGFLDYFPAERLQIVGKTEVTFWNTLAPKLRKERLRDIFRMKPAGFVVCHDQPPPKDLCEMAENAGVAVFATPVPTMKFLTDLMLYLEERLAPSVTIHGSLVDVFGVGVLLFGESGIGKSECALALLDKGHRLCADDVVEMRRTPEKTLLGGGIKQLGYHMEIRGLGIMDIQGLFGARGVRERKLVELVVQLVQWEPGQTYDRTGLDDLTHTILDVALPLHKLPVRPGRNLAVLVEVAAMNWRLKQMGVNSAERLSEQILRDLKRDPGKASPRVTAGARRKRNEER